MDDDELYDEFGNLIGDSFDSDAKSSSDERESIHNSKSDEERDAQHNEDGMEVDSSTALVKTEPSQVSLSLKNTFQPGVETIIAKPYEEAADEPVLQPKINKKIKVDFTDNMDNVQSLDEKLQALPTLNYSRQYMVDTMKLTERIRNVAIVGNLHSGKTTFIDNLVLDTHSPSIQQGVNMKTLKPLRFMDNHKLEISRGISIKSSSITLLLPDSKDKSYVLNLIDSPGHPNFSDEASASIQAADGILLVIDILEGITPRDKEIVSEALRNDIPITVLLNKIDRLILELRLPPLDSYHKIQYTLDVLNSFIDENEYSATYSWSKIISPIHDNVIFASSNQRFSFSISTFAQLYIENHSLGHVDKETFSKLLWASYYNPETKKFSKTSESGNLPRSFVHFILEPIYKIFTHTLTTDTSGEYLSDLLWNNFGITLPKSLFKQDSQILLREVLLKVFQGSKDFVDVMKKIPCPEEAKKYKLSNYTNASNEQLVAHIINLTESADASKFYAFVRVYLGTLKVGSKVKVLGRGFANDDEDFKVEIIDEIYIPGGRYKVPVEEVGPGSIAIVGGIDAIVTKSATICDLSQKAEHAVLFKPLDYSEKSVFKVSIEPENPSELPKLLEGLRKVNKAYLSVVIKVEESGEHILLAPGELYLDCVLHDLRVFFTDDLDIKVSDPVAKFSETCIDTSVTKISVKAPSKKYQISVIAEPMDTNVGKAIESGKLNLSDPIKTTSKILRKDFGWDALAARSVWSFGPFDNKYPSLFMDDTLEGETDKELLYSVKDLLNTGFKLGINEGPLCDEPIRNTKFKILDAVLNGSEITKAGSHLIPMTRNAVHTGMLTATPRLLEPIYRVDATCKPVALSAIKRLLSNRRGDIVNKSAIPGTQLLQVEGYVPVVDSIGLESDIRLHTQGQAMCFLTFEKWDLVPGDPLDKDCYLPSLKPVPNESIARDFVMKTRRRKGLSGEPNLQKYIDPELYGKLKDGGLVN